MVNYNYLEIVDNKSFIEVYLNRPEKLNAINEGMLNELIDAFQKALRDESVKVIVIRGKNKNFCAGGDLNEIYNFKKSKALEFHRKMNRLVNYVLHPEKIFIAIYEGYALGAGFELSLYCDLRFASKNSKIGYPGLRYNLIGASGGSVILPRIVGRGNAMKLILFSTILDSETAKFLGIVQEVWDDNEVDKKIQETVSYIASFDSKVLKYLKSSIISSLGLSELNNLLEAEALAYADICELSDTKERIVKFLKK